ncbi:hypothetical protein [Noviherbaspirillum sp.]|uniref:hypothetical protein n=1 Tax=Noviherbaspirillum sp. TaxID=1926288 RepID=UPI002FDFAF8F
MGRVCIVDHGSHMVCQIGIIMNVVMMRLGKRGKVRRIVTVRSARRLDDAGHALKRQSGDQ